MAPPEVTRTDLPASGGGHADHLPFGDVLAELPRSAGACSDAAVVVVEIARADSLAAGRSAPEVCALLGAFFETVAAVTGAHGGYTERDDLCAVRCVFGDPASSMCGADAALAGAREIRDRLAAELPDVPFSIGVSVGSSGAGWIRAARRFEPLVICAPATEARRLCGLARRRGPSVLASERALARASSAEACHWSAASPAAHAIR